MGLESPWYVEFFREDYPRLYESRLSVKQTQREVDFIERVIGLKQGSRVLDLACGQGRHAVALAKRGMRVTAQDLSEDYLRQVEESAEAEGVKLETVTSDMRRIPFEETFDVVINMFTAFGYLESEGEDLKVLQAVSRALKPGGCLLMDLLNREWVVDNYVRTEERSGDDGTLYIEHRELDLVTSRSRVSFTIASPEGGRREIAGHDIRLYTLTEIIKMLNHESLGFRRVFGGFEAEAYSIGTRRMIMLAEKPG